MIMRFLFQIGKGSRGDVTILPTLVINSRQYRGMELEPTVILFHKCNSESAHLLFQVSWTKEQFLKPFVLVSKRPPNQPFV